MPIVWAVNGRKERVKIGSTSVLKSANDASTLSATIVQPTETIALGDRIGFIKQPEAIRALNNGASGGGGQAVVNHFDLRGAYLDSAGLDRLTREVVKRSGAARERLGVA